jgi:hypothetical protein
MIFKISDKITTKKEILLFREGYKQYFVIGTGKKCFNTAKGLEIGETIDCSGETPGDVFDLIEDFRIVEGKKMRK